MSVFILLIKIKPPNSTEFLILFPLLQDKKRLELFEAAMKRQTEIMIDNILGKGIDIHLLGIKEMALQTTGEVPDMFRDESFITANHFALSTSQVR